jgi:hypothetical protein
MSKVCHTENAQREAFVHRGCAIAHHTMILRDVGFGVLGVQQAAELLRNAYVTRADEPEAFVQIGPSRAPLVLEDGNVRK